MLFFLTPIMFPVDLLPGWLMPYIGLNPLFQYIEYVRALVLDGVIPDLWSNLVCIGFSLLALCVGVYAFMTRQDRFILNL
jgi:ABC-2 type transport system permease protein